MNSYRNCSGVRKAYAGLGNSLRMIGLIIPLLLINACGPGEYAKAYAEQANSIADSVSSYIGELHTDTINGVAHQFIRTADLQCKVKDLMHCNQRIEDLAKISGGYVESSEITSEKENVNCIRFKKDSVLEQTHYTSRASLRLRIPSVATDSVLREITAMAVFVDHRISGSNDVKWQLYSNVLAEKRFADYNKRVKEKIDRSNARIDKVTEAEEKILEKHELADNGRIETYTLGDKVNYSTIQVQLYEDQKVMSRVTAAPNAVQEYVPSFLGKLGDALLNGFELLKNLILFFANIWSVLLIMALLFFGIKKTINYYTRKLANNTTHP